MSGNLKSDVVRLDFFLMYVVPELQLELVIFRDHLSIRKGHICVQIPPLLLFAFSKVRHLVAFLPEFRLLE